MKRVAVVMVVALGLGMGASGVAWAQQDDEDEGPMSNMHFVVVREYNGKAVKNAAVVLHPVKRNGKQSMGGLELKTDSEGRAAIDGIPYGSLRIQVLAPGYQTYGEDFDVNKPETEITVKLKRPGKQYSIYEQHAADKKPAEPKPAEPKPAEQKPQ